MKYKDLCNKAIGDMNKEELFEFANGLLEEVWNYEERINKAIEYIKKYGTESEKEINYVKYNNKEYCICASDFNEGASLILEILGDKENE